MENKEPKIIFDPKLMPKAEFDCIVGILDDLITQYLNKKKKEPP